MDILTYALLLKKIKEGQELNNTEAQNVSNSLLEMTQRIELLEQKVDAVSLDPATQARFASYTEGTPSKNEPSPIEVRLAKLVDGNAPKGE